MFFLEKYFNSENRLLLFLPLIVFSAAHIWHYLLVMNFQTELFANTIKSIREEILSDEKAIFNENLIGNGLTYILQIIGVIVILNIGLLFFEEKVKFRKVAEITIKSSIILTSIYFIITGYFYFKQDIYNFTDLYSIETNYSLAAFNSNSHNIAFQNTLEAFSITQIVFILFLSLGFKHLMNWEYKKALIKIAKIYAIAFSIWVCFAAIMDINFYQ